MTWTVLWLVGRLGGSVWASTLQKRLLLAGVGTGRLWLATYGLMALPAALLLAFARTPFSKEFGLNAVLAALLDVAGNLAMVAALRTTDLSVFGPLNAFRPALALLFGWIFLGEVPSWGGAGGVAIIVLGAVWLLSGDPPESNLSKRAASLATVAWRILGLSLSTVGSVFLKRATAAGSPELTLGVWVLVGGLGLWVSVRLIPSPGRSAWTPMPNRERPLLVQHAAVFFPMQWLTLKVFQHTLLVYSFAFFQLGMVLQVLLGRWLFGEAQFGRRLLCCLVMSAGAVLVMWAG